MRVEINKRVFGYSGEQKALEFLEGQGLSLVERNCYLGRIGELDLVMTNPLTREIVFVEVRSLLRSPIAAEQVISQQKLSRLMTCSRLWLYRRGLSEFKHAHRIDLVVVDFRVKPARLDWFERIA
jgi:Holliday junction resolvase-like predicted endonuclease